MSRRRNLLACTLPQRTAQQISSRISNLTRHKGKTRSFLPTSPPSDKALQILCRNCVNLHKCLLSHLPMKPFTSVCHYCLYNTLVTTKMRSRCLGAYCSISGFEVAVSALCTNYGFELTVLKMMFKKNSKQEMNC